MEFRWKTRILFIDTDASGRIHYTCLFRYFEATEMEFFRSVGVLHKHPGIGFPRVHVECDYRVILRFDDPIVVAVTVGKLGTSSIELKFRVFRDDVEAASGKVVIACLDYNTLRATEMPQLVREKLAPYLEN